MTEEKASPYALVLKYESEFAASLPSHLTRQGEGWTKQVAALTRNDGIAKALRQGAMPSFIAALRTAARLGLAPGSEEFYLVPFGNKVEGIIGYQGQVELMFRAGAVASVVCEIVRERDEFAYTLGVDRLPLHRFDPFASKAERGEKRGVYAYAIMTNGAVSRVVVMGAEEVAEHKAVSKTANRADSPWQKWPDAMWRKTAVHELAKWVPTSPEIIRVQVKAAHDGLTGRNDLDPTGALPEPDGLALDAGDVIDGEIVEDEPTVDEVTGEVLE